MTASRVEALPVRWFPAVDVVAFALAAAVLVLRASIVDGSLVFVGIGGLVYFAVRLAGGPRRG